MSESATPITDAVRDALDPSDETQIEALVWRISWYWWDNKREDYVAESVDCAGARPMHNKSRCVAKPADPADAASALRAIADALSPDPTRRALEIAAWLGMLSDKVRLRDGGNFPYESEQQLFRVIELLLHPTQWVPDNLRARSETATRLINRIGKGMVGQFDSECIYWLQAAREFFEQCEEEAANVLKQ